MSDNLASHYINLSERIKLIKKKLLAASAITALGLVGVFGPGLAGAQSSASRTGLIDKLASRFNLNKADVQAVFDENMQERQAAHESEIKQRIDQAVTDGKLTKDQADKLKAKVDELKTFRDSLKDKTEEERHSAMKAKMDELKQWLKDNNIPQGLGLFPGRDGFHDGPPPDSGI